jgi:hypothetical protein
MTQMTLEVSDELAARIRPLGAWLGVLLELGLTGFKTLAAATAAEVIEFLSANPSDRQVLAYQASERAQERLRRLLTLNEAGMLGEGEQRELDELQKIEHLVVLLKARAEERLQGIS